MEKDPFKHKAPREEENAFRALFGCSPVVVLMLWYKLSNTNLIPDQGTMTHWLWTLMHCKQYERHKGTSSVRHPLEVLHRWKDKLRLSDAGMKPSTRESSKSKCVEVLLPGMNRSLERLTL
jgi:hypothetical protein